ncbi:MAG: VOC family protein [Deltaproteobacteria bacterium]|nr:VOC family protein [Deltaproteobacteria bacterium]MBW2413472.1 VOC family protein [Deltaproteobacteria bacterium]
MRLAKPRIDVGLYTEKRDPMLEFWQNEAGLPYEELLPAGRGVQQHRHGMNGSVLKVNHSRDPLPESPPSGYRELFIAREGLAEVRPLVDPDGNRVTLVPPGTDGVTAIGLALRVRDEDEFHHFYGESLQFERQGPRSYLCGDSLLRFEADPEATSEAAGAAALRAAGFRYITIQVHDVDAEHAGILARGGGEGMPPTTLGKVARISFVTDPDGNSIEISQRASLTGPLG